jgi:hypothetical protein
MCVYVRERAVLKLKPRRNLLAAQLQRSSVLSKVHSRSRLAEQKAEFGPLPAPLLLCCAALQITANINYNDLQKFTFTNDN